MKINVYCSFVILIVLTDARSMSDVSKESLEYVMQQYLLTSVCKNTIRSEVMCQASNIENIDQILKL